MGSFLMGFWAFARYGVHSYLTSNYISACLGSWCVLFGSGGWSPSQPSSGKMHIPTGLCWLLCGCVALCCGILPCVLNELCVCVCAGWLQNKGPVCVCCKGRQVVKGAPCPMLSLVPGNVDCLRMPFRSCTAFSPPQQQCLTQHALALSHSL